MKDNKQDLITLFNASSEEQQNHMIEGILFNMLTEDMSTVQKKELISLLDHLKPYQVMSLMADILKVGSSSFPYKTKANFKNEFVMAVGQKVNNVVKMIDNFNQDKKYDTTELFQSYKVPYLNNIMPQLLWRCRRVKVSK